MIYRNIIYLAPVALFLIGLPAQAAELSGTSTQAITVASTSKVVALTFDDGPYGTSTAQILHILEQENVPATFFVMGENVTKYPLLVKQMVADGDALGNHTEDHPFLSKLSTEQSLAEIALTDQAIASTTGEHTRLFRAPYGVLPKKTRQALLAEGYHIYLWNVDPTDWNYKHSPSDVIVSRVLSHEQNHMVIILHDGRDTHINYPRDNTVSALPKIIDALKRQGYVFVTVDSPDLNTENRPRKTSI
jgi:peptidoglycan/xylan/chitin deacetylase (PgdA/CDA1 family)